MLRADKRQADTLRPVRFQLHYTRWAEGSVLIECGHTHVLCNVSIEETLPPWLMRQEQPHGWITAEYAMLPRSTHTRTRRERRWPRGRTQEISRLIGRSLRMAVDLSLLGERTVTVDCDVLQADGGTRTAAITGGWVALQLALRPLIENGAVPAAVTRHQLAAVSVGLVEGIPLLDLAYEEDSRAQADLNIIMTDTGKIVELQGTAERALFSRQQLDRLLDLASSGIDQLLLDQRVALGPMPE